MHGPVEVEQVTHHFGHDTGFVTTIVPNLVCNVNNPLQNGSLVVAGSYMDSSSALVQEYREAFSAPFFWAGGPVLGNWAAGIVFWFTQLSQTRREPISFTPLLYARRPFIAGIEGMRQTSMVEAIQGAFTRFKVSIMRTYGTGGTVDSSITTWKLKASQELPRICKEATAERKNISFWGRQMEK
jgi:hypothetical protein